MTIQKPNINILYIHIGLSSFVKKDIHILKSEFNVFELYFNVNNKKRIPLEFLKQFYKLAVLSRKTNCFVIQFAGFHSVLPVLFSKILKKKSIIVLGGTDCVSFPSINYGNFNRYFLAKATKLSLNLTNLLLPVDDTLVKYKYTYQSEDFDHQGYLFHAPNVKTKSEVIYNGYDSIEWDSHSEIKEENSFVTIAANLGSRFGIQLKGIDLFIELASFFPDYKFYIVGGYGIQIPLTDNVILLENIKNEELPSFLSSKQYYLQLSMSEGFPNALCEAMLCNCTPIVSNVGAMPKIVDNEELILKEKDINQLVEIIKKINLRITNPEVYRNKIITNFSIERRKTELIEKIRELNS